MKCIDLLTTTALITLSATSCTVVKTQHHITLDHNIKIDMNMSALPKNMTHFNSPTNYVFIDSNSTEFKRHMNRAGKDSNSTMKKTINRIGRKFDL